MICSIKLVLIKIEYIIVIAFLFDRIYCYVYNSPIGIGEIFLSLKQAYYEKRNYNFTFASL